MPGRSATTWPQLAWERRLEAERQSEAWKRDKCDVVEVPGLTRRSEAILKQLDGLPQAEKPKFLGELSGTPEGKHALEEARQIALALTRRFGSANLRDLKTENLRLGQGASANLDRIRAVARIVERVQRAELSRQYELKRTLNRGFGLGL
jgi:hypothetical protein